MQIKSFMYYKIPHTNNIVHILVILTLSQADLCSPSLAEENRCISGASWTLWSHLRQAARREKLPSEESQTEHKPC